MIKEKISGCFTNFKGTEIFNIIKGYMSIVKKNNKSVLGEMRNLLNGQYYMPSLARCWMVTIYQMMKFIN